MFKYREPGVIAIRILSSTNTSEHGTIKRDLSYYNHIITPKAVNYLSTN